LKAYFTICFSFLKVPVSIAQLGLVGTLHVKCRTRFEPCYTQSFILKGEIIVVRLLDGKKVYDIKAFNSIFISE
jgi:hypothetical protein